MTLNLSYPFGPTFKPGKAVLGPVVLFDDFIYGGYDATQGAKFNEQANEGEWLFTDGGVSVTNPTISDAGHGGWVTFEAQATDGIHAQMQVEGESFKCNDGRELYFETRMKIEAVTANFFVGMSVTGDDLWATPSDDCVAFLLSGDADIETLVRANKGSATGTKRDSGSDITADTFTTLAFHMRSNKTVDFYVDGEKVYHDTGLSGSTQTFPDDEELSPIFLVESSGAGSEAITIDYVLVANTRP